MKAINTSVRATGFAATQLAYSTDPGTRAFGKRAARRQERRLLKMSLHREIQGEAGREIEQVLIENRLKREREYRSLIERVSAIASPRRYRDWAQAQCIPLHEESTYEPDGSRNDILTRATDGSFRLFASCAIED